MEHISPYPIYVFFGHPSPPCLTFTDESPIHKQCVVGVNLPVADKVRFNRYVTNPELKKCYWWITVIGENIQHSAVYFQGYTFFYIINSLITSSWKLSNLQGNTSTGFSVKISNFIQYTLFFIRNLVRGIGLRVS